MINIIAAAKGEGVLLTGHGDAETTNDEAIGVPNLGDGVTVLSYGLPSNQIKIKKMTIQQYKYQVHST